MKKIKILSLLALILIFAACTPDDAAVNESSGGEASVGSYANMLTYGNRLYLISSTEIITMDITERSIPVELDRQPIGFRIESLFRRGETLFIGSATDLYIYGIGNDGIPQELSVTNYGIDFPICSFDPVVTNDTIAYVTLSTSTATNCGRVETNELRLFDITDLQKPIQINTVQMSRPKGLGLDGNWLFVCEESQGLKVFDVSDPNNVELLHHFSGYKAFDVIVKNGLLIVVGPDGLYQYDYTDMDNMVLLSQHTLT